MLKKPHICRMNFAGRLLAWYERFGRELPWRDTQDPYIIWLSEIILQQTRVEQGMPYFYAFVEHFPTVKNFADADEGEILRLWQGLGYYSRARNMHKAAKMVRDEMNGLFPTSYEEAIRLPGVGEYTAAAIASFSSNECKAVVDGNVYRVLSRYMAIDTPINSTSGKKIFAQLAQELISPEHPGLYNQAIMDFGATVCKPKGPLCETCIFREDCRALAMDLVDELPVKNKGKASRNRYFHYFIFERGDEILLSQRTEGDVWANLYEFPMIETNDSLELDAVMALPEFMEYFGEASLLPIGKEIKHVLSHQNIHARFYKLENIVDIRQKKPNWNYFMSDKMDKLAKHKLIFSFMNKYFNQSL